MGTVGAEVRFNFDLPSTGLGWVLVMFATVVGAYVISRGLVSLFDSASTRLRPSIYIVAVLLVVTVAAYAISDSDSRQPTPLGPSTHDAGNP